MRSRFAVPVTMTCWCVGLLLGVQDGPAVSGIAVASTAVAGLVIAPATGTALIAALPEVVDAERWRPGDLFLPALASCAAFSFVVSQVIYAALGSWETFG